MYLLSRYIISFKSRIHKLNDRIDFYLLSFANITMNDWRSLVQGVQFEHNLIDANDWIMIIGKKRDERIIISDSKEKG
jgi:hypothetical protein